MKITFETIEDRPVADHEIGELIKSDLIKESETIFVHMDRLPIANITIQESRIMIDVLDMNSNDGENDKSISLKRDGTGLSDIVFAIFDEMIDYSNRR